MNNLEGTVEPDLTWTPEAWTRLQQVPEGMMRGLTRQRVEKLARRLGRPTVTLELMDAKYRQWAEGSEKATSELTWTDDALVKIERIPTFVRPMIVGAIEAYAQRQGLAKITPELVDEAKGFWGESGRFHQP